MRYPVMIEAGTDTTAWGVVVPDLPLRRPPPRGSIRPWMQAR